LKMRELHGFKLVTLFYLIHNLIHQTLYFRFLCVFIPILLFIH